MRGYCNRRGSCWRIVAFVLLFVCLTSFHYPMDFLTVHIGKPYESVVRESTFPVIRKTAIYPSEPPEVDSTWISSPVILKFDDPVHGFTLPATVFGAVGYRKERVITITTSPMVETLPYDQTAKLLGDLQSMFRNAGWTPELAEGNDWIKVSSDEEKRQLQAKLFDQLDGVILLVPHRYSLIMHIKCYVRCDERDPKTARYLIDVGLGEDHFSD